MKHTRLALVLAITSLTATPVIAASLTMLQFGSFETKDEAEKRLGEVKAKHAAEIGSLGTNIREVKLPPDNLTVYRTQAGPVADRAAAQSICSKLASAGDECYIVQTAMVTAPQTISEAAAAPAPTSTLATTSLLADEKKPSDATDLTSRLSSLQGVPERDASSKAALSSVNSTLSTPADAPVASGAMSEPSPAMQAALDKAAAEQPKAEQSIAESTGNATTKPSKGFWSHLNPFSGSEHAAEVKPAPINANAAPIDAVTSATVEAPVAMSATTPTPAIELPPLEPAIAVPNAAVATPVAATPTFVPAPAPAPVAAAPMMMSAPVITQAEPLRLPPPPAPLKAQDAAKLEAMKTQPATAPVSTGAIAVAPLQPAAGSVNVEEAKRVPVTEMAMPPAQQVAVPVIQHAQPTPIQPPVSLSPSATEGQKSIWAQVGPFANNEAALTYWADYRQNHPDFPVVRVRVITPYQMPGQAWLRVGPVTREGFVRNLCAGMTKESKLRCGTVADMGMSSSLQKPKLGFLTPERYKH